MNGASRQLRTTALNRSTFLWINSESKNVTGSNNNFSYDIGQTPLDKNKPYKFIIKSVTAPNNSPQITARYNYNTINYEIVRDSDSTVMTTRQITIAEGTYDSAQLVFVVAQTLNNDFASVAGTYGGDAHTITYSDITNRITFRRTTFTTVGGQSFFIRLLANDANSTYDGTFGFGMGFILGLAYGGTLNLPRASVTADVACPSSPSLQPYLYYSILIDGINNYNHSSDIPSVNNICFRIPLTIGQGRYGYTFIEENNPDFGELYVSTLPSRLNFRVVDQYGQLFGFSENSALDLCIKLTPID